VEKKCVATGAKVACKIHIFLDSFDHASNTKRVLCDWDNFMYILMNSQLIQVQRELDIITEIFLWTKHYLLLICVFLPDGFQSLWTYVDCFNCKK